MRLGLIFCKALAEGSKNLACSWPGCRAPHSIIIHGWKTLKHSESAHRLSGGVRSLCVFRRRLALAPFKDQHQQ